MLELAIGLGLAVNLILVEVFGYASGGLVVPGYLAVFLDQPARLAGTFLLSFVTWFLIRHVLERLFILYGRRRFSVTVLTGFLVNALFAQFLQRSPTGSPDMRAIGLIIPGLIANEMLNQGTWPTIVMTLLVAAVVRLLLALFAGWSW